MFNIQHEYKPTLINNNFLNLTNEDIRQLLQERKLGAIVTDLPYGTIKNSTWDYDLNLEHMWQWITNVSKEFNVNLPVISTSSQPFTSKLIVSNLKHYSHNWVWNKKLAGNGMLAKKQPLKIHEDVVVFYMGSVVYYPQMVTGKPRKKMTKVDNIKGYGTYGETITVDEYYNDQYYPQSIIEFSVAHLRGKKRRHLAEKPIELYEYLIQTYTQPNEVVLDICMGSGTTCIAAHNVGRHCVGIEIDEEIYRNAKQKVLEYTKGLNYTND